MKNSFNLVPFRCFHGCWLLVYSDINAEKFWADRSLHLIISTSINPEFNGLRPFDKTGYFPGPVV